MAQRIGFYSLRKFARKLCGYVFQFTPIIKLVYPDATDLHAALAAANAACQTLVEEIDEVAPQGV